MARPTLRLYDGYSHTSPHLRDDVKELQTLLRGLGYRVRPDGEFGPYTENVVRLFQASKGLGGDGGRPVHLVFIAQKEKTQKSRSDLPNNLFQMG